MASLRSNSLRSLFYLLFQSGYSAVLGLVANLIVTALAAKEVFGIYATTLATISIFNYISDIGLAGALIQKKDVRDQDLTTVFTVQQILVVSLVIVGFCATPYVTLFYHLPHDAVILYWSVLAGFFISSLKTIPSVLLERSVHFAGIVRVQVVENTLFYIVVSLGILAGLGLYSFAIAVFARSVTGTILMYRRSHWKPVLGLHRESLRELLSFGIPFQANSFLALVKDELMVIFLGKTLGFQGLAEIMWAKKWAESPIRIIMDNVSKILFPLLSRLQDDPAKRNRTVVATLYLQTAVLGPAILAIGVGMPILIKLLPQYAKWNNALPILYVFCASAFFSTMSTPFMNVFNALKRPKVPFIFMIAWTVATWVFTPWFTRTFGPIGFAYVQLILSSSFILVMYSARRAFGFRYSDIGQIGRDISSVLVPYVVRLKRSRQRASDTATHYEEDKLE